MAVIIVTAAILVLVSILAALSLGSEHVAFSAVIRSIQHGLSAQPVPTEIATDARIVWLLWAPRALLALVVGGGLAVIGVGMQTLVRNPLAEPYILGISSGASAGLSLFYVGLLPPLAGTYASRSIAGFVGGLAAIAIVYLIARSGRSISVSRLLLAGIAMSSLMGAVSSFVTFASPDPGKLRAVLFLLLGSLHGATWEALIIPSAAALGGLAVLAGLSRSLDAMLIGEEAAQNLGVPVERAKRILIGLAALVTGTLVAVAGPIGFVGLIIPHSVRIFTGVTHRRLLPLSFMAGGVFLIWTDLIARTVLPAQDLPVGILTALCGVPFFLYLLRRQQYAFG